MRITAIKNYLNKYRVFTILGFLAVFALGLALGRFTVRVNTVPINKVLREAGHKYIGPVLLCNDNIERPDNEDIALKRKVQAYINNAPAKEVAMYYLDLNKGTWAGVNEDEIFSPASMLKVPTVAAVLKYVESHEAILTKEIFYDGSFDDNKLEYFKPQSSIQPGHYYSVAQLLQYTIVNSDNNAVRLLHGVIDLQSVGNIYLNLGIQIPAAGGIDFMSPQTYSRFLRLLYNSTYLSREMSEKLLRLMVATDFTQGLVAGLPSGIEVARKFGERQVLNLDGTIGGRELHDCGIVYAKNPYVVCVMTQGEDFNQLASEIRDISKLVYTEVSSR